MLSRSCILVSALAALLAYVGTANAARLGMTVEVGTAGSRLSWTSDTKIAALADGGYVVVWTGEADRYSRHIYYRRYDKVGRPREKPIRVGQQLGSYGFGSAVVGLSDGGFVIVWQKTATHTSPKSFVGQRFGADGKQNGQRLHVNPGPREAFWLPRLIAMTDGGFVLAWRRVATGVSRYPMSDFRLQGRRYDRHGQPTGIGFQIKPSRPYSHLSYTDNTIAPLPKNRFVVGWVDIEDEINKDPIWRAFTQRFNGDGTAMAARRLIAIVTPPTNHGIHSRPVVEVGRLANGGYVVSWLSEKAPNVKLYTQRFGPDGRQLGGATHVDVGDAQSLGGVTGLSSGRFVVFWNASRIKGQLFSAAGRRLGVAFEVDPKQQRSSLGNYGAAATLKNNGFAFAWPSVGSDTAGPRVQRYGRMLTAFPLAGQRPGTAEVLSVFDHSMMGRRTGAQIRPNTCDGRLLAANGANGLIKNGTSAPICQDKGYYQNRIDPQPWKLGWMNYVGTGDGNVLNYDGHTGIDYKAACGTPVYAAAAGIIGYPKSIVGAVNASKFHTLSLMPLADRSYRIYYQHLATYPFSTEGVTSCWLRSSSMVGKAKAGCYFDVEGNPFTPLSLPLPSGTRVRSGCLIGLSGDAGVPGNPHLHFEVQRMYNAADVSPTVGPVIQCWKEVPHNNPGPPQRIPGKVCLPLDPYGWNAYPSQAMDCSSSDPNQWTGDIYACQSGVPSDVLWR